MGMLVLIFLTFKKAKILRKTLHMCTLDSEKMYVGTKAKRI